MEILKILAVIVVSYLIGSIPFGWIIVKLTTGRDVRNVESGRTVGTNVWRAAGLGAGALTALLDVLKGASVVWIARHFIPATIPFFHLVEIAAPLAAVLGHNYSIYLIELYSNPTRVILRGGAGGSTSLGGAIGLWWPSALFIVPLAGLIYFFLGYASVTTMSIALSATVVFLVKAIQGGLPWEYVLYGVIAEAMLAWALRPNIRRLIAGNERIHGFRVWLKNRKEKSP
jgi:glycerol-3-phosphate acyltransferase PlsY